MLGTCGRVVGSHCDGDGGGGGLLVRLESCVFLLVERARCFLLQQPSRDLCLQPRDSSATLSISTLRTPHSALTRVKEHLAANLDGCGSVAFAIHPYACHQHHQHPCLSPLYVPKSGTLRPLSTLARHLHPWPVTLASLSSADPTPQ